ncbi:26945_t:CDS:2, partial [Gigaspora margarita]
NPITENLNRKNASNRVFYYKRGNSSMIKKNNKRPLNKTERFSEDNSAKCTLTKKTNKTRNSIAIITDNREDNTFCFLNPDIQAFTWSNSSTGTRIDQILIFEGLIKNLYKAEILDMDLIIESDHSTVLVNLKNTLNKDMNKISQKDINNIWISIETRILYAAKQNIPFRRIPNSTKKALSTNKKTKSLLQKDTISISKICQKLKKLAREDKDQKAILALSSKRALEIRLLLYKINARHKQI